MAIVGARRADHIAESVAAADLRLDSGDLEAVERTMADAVEVAGPSPEAV